MTAATETPREDDREDDEDEFDEEKGPDPRLEWLSRQIKLSLGSDEAALAKWSSTAKQRCGGPTWGIQIRPVRLGLLIVVIMSWTKNLVSCFCPLYEDTALRFSPVLLSRKQGTHARRDLIEQFMDEEKTMRLLVFQSGKDLTAVSIL